MARAIFLPQPWTAGELLEALGGIDPHRVLLAPPPGRATARDLIRRNECRERLFELVDGVLVAKVSGFPESVLAAHLGCLLSGFILQQELGFLPGAAGPVRLRPGVVRLPDVSFFAWDRVPVRGQIPDMEIAFPPDLAVEVRRDGNTPGEMERKLKEYFLAGIRLVWFVDRVPRTVQIFTAPDRSQTLTEEQTLDGGDVLPGLALPVRQVFARMPPAPAERSPRRKKSGPGGKRPKKRGPR